MISLLLFVVGPLLVFGFSIENPNHALFKYSELSSTLGTYRASLANDGTTPNWEDACAVTTGSELWNWWLVDMETDLTINSIRITSDLKQVPLCNFSIELTAGDPKTLIGFPGPVAGASVCLFQTEEVPTDHPTAYSCDQPTTGRYARLVQHNPTRRQKLRVCELEAYSDHAKNFTIYPPARNNIALKKPTSQSSTHTYSTRSSVAVDGKMDPIIVGRSDSCTHTRDDPANPWWMVDLEGVYVMDTFRVVNRGECCQYRLRNFTIEVTLDNPTSLDGFPGKTSNASACLTQIDPINYGAPVTLRCDRPMEGRYVRVILEDLIDPLTLCEFEAFELMQRFELVDVSETWTRHAIENSPQEMRHVMSCARQFKAGVASIVYTAPSRRFLHVDLEDGRCRHLEHVEDSKFITTSGRWVVYTYE